jgi:hypothetical protein
MMPRKAPKEVIEHRITFGDYERKRLNELQNSISFAQYASPLRSPVVAVGLAGGLGYLGLAWWLEWWPFDSEGWNPWEQPFFEDNKDMFSSKNECRLAEWLTNRYETVLLPKHNEQLAAAQKWLDDNPSPSGIMEMMKHKQNTLIVMAAPLKLENLEKEYQQNLTKAQAMDVECVAKKEKENKTK